MTQQLTPTGLDGIPEVSVAVPDTDGFGHLAELRVDPIALFDRGCRVAGFESAPSDAALLERASRP